MPKILDDEQIYRAVMQVIAKRGYSGATTKQMANAANVSEVTLFRKYGSKQQLVKQAISLLLSQTNLASAAQYTGDIHADLMRIVQAYQDSAEKYGDFITSLFAEMSQHPELVASIDEPLKIFSTIAALIARYQKEGYLKSEPPLHTVGVLLGSVMYTTILRKTIPKNQLPPLDLANHVTCFLEGHRA